MHTRVELEIVEDVEIQDFINRLKSTYWKSSEQLSIYHIGFWWFEEMGELHNKETFTRVEVEIARKIEAEDIINSLKPLTIRHMEFTWEEDEED